MYVGVTVMYSTFIPIPTRVFEEENGAGRSVKLFVSECMRIVCLIVSGVLVCVRRILLTHNGLFHKSHK